MRIAIATDDGQVAAHFGRCPHYTLVDLEDGKEVNRHVVANPGHEPGRIPELLHRYSAEVIIAGGMGRRAQELFDDMGIDQIVGVEGRVDEVVQACLDGTLAGGESLCSHGSGHGDGAHHGHGAESGGAHHGGCEHGGSSGGGSPRAGAHGGGGRR